MNWFCKSSELLDKKSCAKEPNTEKSEAECWEENKPSFQKCKQHRPTTTTWNHDCCCILKSTFLNLVVGFLFFFSLNFYKSYGKEKKNKTSVDQNTCFVSTYTNIICRVLYQHTRTPTAKEAFYASKLARLSGTDHSQDCKCSWLRTSRRTDFHFGLQEAQAHNSNLCHSWSIMHSSFLRQDTASAASDRVVLQTTGSHYCSLIWHSHLQNWGVRDWKQDNTWLQYFNFFFYYLNYGLDYLNICSITSKTVLPWLGLWTAQQCKYYQWTNETIYNPS